MLSHAQSFLASADGLEASKLFRRSTLLSAHPSFRYFSSAVSTAQNREEFVSNILAAYMHYNLDGIDIDWEYPGQSGDSGNQMSSSDTANMLEFFKVLREKLPPTAKISAAVQDTPFEGADHEPIKDASGFAKLLDFVTLMNYDDFESKWFHSGSLPWLIVSQPQIRLDQMRLCTTGAETLLGQVKMPLVVTMPGVRPAFRRTRSYSVFPLMATSSPQTLRGCDNVPTRSSQ